MIRKILPAALAASLSMTAACSGDANDAADTGEPDVSTVAALASENDDLEQVSDLLGDTGLQPMFDGNAPYTIFAPSDDALDTMNQSLAEEDMRAAQVAVLREHIVPGFLTREDIDAAIERSGGPVEMETMGSNTLTFSKDAQDIVITSSDGAEARLASPGRSGVNGTVFVVDGVLKNLEPVSE